MASNSSSQNPTTHRFLDEMGDTTFFGKGKTCALGQVGVSSTFGIALVKIERPLNEVREEVKALHLQVENDPLLNTIPSVVKRIDKKGFFFHACKDVPEIRSVFLRYIATLPCVAEIVVGRKIPRLFERNHGSRQDEFYADILSYLIKGRLKKPQTVVLNIAERGSSTRSKILDGALARAISRATKKWAPDELKSRIVFNVQNPLLEPLLCISDYIGWSVQRVFETGDVRFYNYLKPKIRLVIDLYDSDRYPGNRNYYTKANPLTAQNKISPQTT